MSVRLTYFAGYGLAEQTRWLLAYAKVPFSQRALASFSQFDELRNDRSLLFKQLPLLEIDGLKVTQSQAMVRYVARKYFGAVGDDVWVRSDMIAEACKDCRLGMVKWPFSSSKDVHIKEFVPPLISKWFPLLDPLAEIKDDSEITYAHVLIAEMVYEYDLMFESKGLPSPSTEFKNLKDLTAKITATPQMVEYLNSDKRFPFPAEGERCDAYVENVEVVLGRR
ncbi:hypothetical protein TrLO_g13582 [Triparma laevis f. longispina]|uniref:GST N-terminal domain-containing protein n=1 Tax=Triparma laevis f. longispina TaxID=1714387 RepID=A0A9W7B240_9STRA|nr:hypothetical protein TrLO_g13582 [Triparma laevis f. longispina]